MLAKLAFRNVKRSAKDYLVYFLTMTFVTAMMFAFNTVIFSADLQGRVSDVDMMQVLIILATVFVVIIIAWLINYMVRFMLQKRSREFGTYLLLGMRKRMIAHLYMRENIVLGAGAFLLGLVLGILLQQILLSILFGILQEQYHLQIVLDFRCVLMTMSCYAGCYILALFRCSWKFRKMNIRELMYAGQQNEEIKESHEEWKKWLFPASILILCILAFNLFCGKNWSMGDILVFLVSLVAAIYLFYMGLSSWIVCYVRKKGSAVYRGENLFLLRQFSSKVKTMQFTMGTLTALFTVAMLGCAFAMMFADYQNQMLEQKFPFDVQVFSEKEDEDFAKELEVLEQNTRIKDAYPYSILQNGTSEVSIWLSSHLDTFGDTYRNADGTPDLKKIEDDKGAYYGTYDTYMSLSVYNHLREMLGYAAVSLEEGEYLIHLKERIYAETGDFSEGLSLQGTKGELRCGGYRTEPFSQDGHNGADYLIVVCDSEAEEMDIFYRELAVDIEGEAPNDLGKRLDDLAELSEEEIQDLMGHVYLDEMDTGHGTDTVVVYYAKNLVRDNLIPEVKYMLSSVIFPLFYIGLVFLCVALTVLSVQQLSDSAKYRFRYGVLRKIGLKKKELASVVWKQLFMYFLCPALFAAVLSGVIILFVSAVFVKSAGLHTSVLQYFSAAFVLFFGIYAIYFTTTYVGFLRNVDGTASGGPHSAAG